jgi:gamma-glutamylcyclotransferase (GGCT)/AIG2-like uncharacterized protein YtfP
VVLSTFCDTESVTVELLFTYGTLAPEDPEGAIRDGWTPDLVRGRLFDLGPYPALVDVDDPAAGWVEGYVRLVDPEALAGPLDDYEGVAEGRYRRVAVTTHAGRRAWVYVYARPVPSAAPGPLVRWEGRRGGLAGRGPDVAFRVPRRNPERV